MRTTVGTVGKWDVEQLGVVGGLLHTGADGVLGWWAFEFDHRSVLRRGWLVRDRNIAAAVGAENALLGGAEGAAAVAGEGGVGGAFHLKGLHPRKKIEELRGQRVGVEAGGRKGEQELVRGLERGEATVLGLLLDEEAAWGGGREHHARELLQAWT